ncbi:winged helix-turn-helix transcriptional regulator [Methanosphaerula subterraneus]|uniref:winged helix-turn-helix transcriptional regulator n=1 Tax=Methanosphaerula subterraneus TaxID=3350244 RepID=UPI003F85E57C
MLESGGQLTQKDLIRETSLPSRTVRYALNRLKEEQFLVERYYFIDARQSLYSLNQQQQREVVAV